MTTTTATTIPSQKIGALLTIFLAGITAGVFDIAAAFVTRSAHGIEPIQILHGIASGLIGPKAFDGGWDIAALGMMLHFGIAWSAAAVFYLASRKLLFMTRHSILSGVCYGIAVYLFMYWVVLPLSAYQKPPFSVSATVNAIITHIACVGLPISLVVQRYAKR